MTEPIRQLFTDSHVTMAKGLNETKIVDELHIDIFNENVKDVFITILNGELRNGAYNSCAISYCLTLSDLKLLTTLKSNNEIIFRHKDKVLKVKMTSSYEVFIFLDDKDRDVLIKMMYSRFMFGINTCINYIEKVGGGCEKTL